MSPAREDRLLTLPNLLSASRVPLGGLFWFALGPAPERIELPLGVLAAAAATDVLDGYLARRGGVDPSGVGSWLDPVCDKLFVAGVFAALFFERHVPLSLLALVVTRELLQLPMALVYGASDMLRRWLRYDFRASWLGKAATVCQFSALSAIVAAPALERASGGAPTFGLARRLAEVAFGLGLLALADYIRRAIVMGRRHARTKERSP